MVFKNFFTVDTVIIGVVVNGKTAFLAFFHTFMPPLENVYKTLFMKKPPLGVKMAPQAGLEPATCRLTAGRSTN